MSRYSSIRPNAAASAARVAPPIAMSPSPGSARNRSISSARPPEARRALPCTADSVVENTTFRSGFQIAAHSSIESSSAGSRSPASPYTLRNSEAPPKSPPFLVRVTLDEKHDSIAGLDRLTRTAPLARFVDSRERNSSAVYYTPFCCVLLHWCGFTHVYGNALRDPLSRKGP